MAIRITGMYSGLDTESIINELASAQSYKKNKLVKAQIRHSWKQDAWKSLNTKIYSFYQKLDDMRLQSSYLKKKTTVSNPSAVKVVSGEGTVDGVHSLTVDKLAKQAYLTSGNLETKDGVRFTGRASLKQLDPSFSGEGSISINGALGQSVKINVSADMTINQFVDAVKATGLNASFDQDNQRIYISSKDTGADANFTFTGNDDKGFQALAALGLLTSPPASTDPNYAAYLESAEYKEYAKWQNYGTAAGATAKQELIDAEVAARAQAYKDRNDALEKDNEALKKANENYNEKELQKLDGYSQYGQFSSFAGVSDYAGLKKALYDKIYGEEVEVPKKDANGDPVLDDNNQPVMEKVRQNGLAQELEAAQKDLADKQAAGASQADIDAAKKAVEDVQKEIGKASDCYSYVNAIAGNEALIKANQDEIDVNKTYFEVDASGKVTEDAAGKLRGEVTTEVDTKIAAADKFLTGAYSNGKEAHKIQGQDAEFTLNGVKYESYDNTLTVNGMTITAMEETNGKAVTLSTTSDTDGVYDMIKDLFKSYNELINEMDSLYNADAAKDYEPLTSEEKESLSDKEIEEWENKIKSSLLRRDSTLSKVSSGLKSVMLQGVTVGGKQMYLSDFGINTLGYFKAKENERNAYHINGDADDTAVMAEANDLKTMIATNPDAVMDFFVGLTNNLHDELNEKMAPTKLSSALTVYNDKAMKTEYDDYTDKIKKQEAKLNDYIDKWYAKFSAMETALAKLESKNNSLSSLFGG